MWYTVIYYHKSVKHRFNIGFHSLTEHNYIMLEHLACTARSITNCLINVYGVRTGTKLYPISLPMRICRKALRSIHPFPDMDDFRIGAGKSPWKCQGCTKHNAFPIIFLGEPLSQLVSPITVIHVFAPVGRWNYEWYYHVCIHQYHWCCILLQHLIIPRHLG